MTTTDGDADAVLPVGRGDWVATEPGQPFQIGKVRDCYRESSFDGRAGTVLMDVALYDVGGNLVGRESPALGGPRRYEPAVDFSGWRRIHEPSFPLMRQADDAPTTDADGRPAVRLGVSYHPSVRTRPVRAERAARRPVRPAMSVLAPRTSDYDPQSEAAARRLAAQEMRDLARKAPTAEDLRARAAELEREAEAIAPRALSR